MYIRIARFEGVQPETIDSQIEEVRQRIQEGRQLVASGQAEGPEAEGMRAVKRAMMLVDRQGGRGAAVSFADTEEDIMKVHAWMNSMSPAAGGGQRVSVEIYEVAIDEQAR
jgi:hypothetical protein